MVAGHVHAIHKSPRGVTVNTVHPFPFPNPNSFQTIWSQIPANLRDTRNPSQPLYTHSSTHSDDITHLSLLPPTSSFLPPASGAAGPTPERLLLSASTDGLVALSDVHEADEDEAGLCAENFGESLADAGWYVRDSRGKGKGKGKGMAGMELRVWGRSDMDALGVWEVGRGEGESEWELEVGVELFTKKPQVVCSGKGRDSDVATA